MKYRFFCAAALALALASPVHADLFGFLKKQKTSVDCAPLDRACLIDQTVEMVFSNAAKREVEINTGEKARQLSLLAARMPDEQAQALRQRIVDLNDHPSFLESYDNYIAKTVAVPSMSLDELFKVLKAGRAGNDDYGQMVLNGFTAAFERNEAEAALYFWQQNIDPLWQNGGRAYELIQEWLAKNDSAAFARYTKRYSLFRRNKQRTYADLGMIASQHCRSGALTDGQAVLATLQEAFDTYEWTDPVISLYAQSELFTATLYCEGLGTAERLLNDIKEKSETARVFVIETYPNQAERKFILEAMHDTVELRTTRALAMYPYLVLKDPEAARMIFEGGQSMQSSLTLDVDEDGKAVLRNPAREPLPFKQFERDIDTISRLDPVPEVALQYFLNSYSVGSLEKFEQTGYYIQNHLFGFTDNIAAVWPKDIAQQAAAKSLEIARDISARDADYPMVIDLIQLRLAALPQPLECGLSEAGLQEMLKRLPDYRFGDSRVLTLLTYLDYLEREVQAGTPCAVNQSAQ